MSVIPVHSFCRVGFTCRCIHSMLFGIPILPGGQAQYIRVPKAGGTLFRVSDVRSLSTKEHFTLPSRSSLLLRADILPTGVFAASQALQHAKLSPMLSGVPYPFGSFVPYEIHSTSSVQETDRMITIAVVGLGPVGVVSRVSIYSIRMTLNECPC